MKAISFLLMGLFSSCILFSQNKPIGDFHFDDGLKSFGAAFLSPDSAIYLADQQRPTFSTGLKGLALNLSEKAVLRRPFIPDSKYVPNLNQSFAFQIWVKTLPNAIQGTPISGNKKADELGKIGWQIYTRENGAWALNISDGQRQFNYRPTAKRQGINDGNWHQLAFSIDWEKTELEIFFDGDQVAIYNVAGLKGLSNSSKTVIGGSEDKFEYGSYGQWEAFNGWIDETKIWDRKLSVEEIHSEYLSFFPQKKNQPLILPKELKILSWNIWHGGHRYGKHVGLKRVIEIIKSSEADIITMQETYGSGEIIADSLGFYFYLISTNLSIMSRFPIVETHQIFKPFNSGGATIDLGNGKEIVVFDIWLHYLPDYLKSVTNAGSLRNDQSGYSVKELLIAENETRGNEIRQILASIEPILQSGKTIIMGGDFNSGSHLDWIKATRQYHNDYVVEWPASKEMENAGFMDSYRTVHSNPEKMRGITWSPRAATSSDLYGITDRIDYIYGKGGLIKAKKSRVIHTHPVQFPSDHAAMLTTYEITQP